MVMFRKFFITLLFLFLASPPLLEAACNYLNETFSSSLSSQWTARNGTWSVVNGKLNVSNIAADKLAYAETKFMPPDYFKIDVDVSAVSLSQSNGAYGIYIYTTGDIFFGVGGKTVDGFAIFVWSNNNIKLSAYDIQSRDWYDVGTLNLSAAPTSIGFDVSSSAVTVRINKQNTTLKAATNIPFVFFDTLWLIAQGSGSLFAKGTEVNFDNLCAEPTATTVQYTLTATKGGTGSGTITSNPAGISCGTDCTERYNAGTSVTLSATADAGSVFSGWGGACTGTGACTLTMTSDKTVTAFFSKGSTPASCAATVDSNLLVHVPILKFSNALLGTVYLRLDLQYVFNPSTIMFRLKDYAIMSAAEAAAYNCTHSSLSEALDIHINELIIDGVSFWIDLTYDKTASTGNELYFKAIGYGNNQGGAIAPVPKSPSNGATGQSLTPELSWTGSANATAYRVFVATSSNVLSSLSPTASTCPSCVLTENTGTLTNYKVPAGRLSAGTTYYWVVKAAYSNDQKWSSIWSFTTAPNSGPILDNTFDARRFVDSIFMGKVNITGTNDVTIVTILSFLMASQDPEGFIDNIIKALPTGMASKINNGIKIDFGDGYYLPGGFRLQGSLSITYSNSMATSMGYTISFTNFYVNFEYIADGSISGLITIDQNNNSTITGNGKINSKTGEVTVSSNIQYITANKCRYPTAGKIEFVSSSKKERITFTNRCDGTYDYSTF